MHKTADIIDLSERRRNTRSSAPEVRVVTTASGPSPTVADMLLETGLFILSHADEDHVRSAASKEQRRAPVSFDDLYPSDSKTLTNRIRRVLLENDSRMRSAREQDAIERDEAVNRLKIDLAKIFAYKGLGPGQEMVIVALYHGLRNKRSVAITLDEYNEVLGVIRAMSERPGITVDSALDLVERLQRVGLNTDLEEAGYLHELICD